jgi:four helix bundle protein
MTEKDMRGFEDLECYQLAIKVFHEGYRIASHLPPEEKYNLADQLRRAVTSAVLNIAEGYGRYHYLDNLRFYYMARGSIMETLVLLLSAMICNTPRAMFPNKESYVILHCGRSMDIFDTFAVNNKENKNM